MVSVLNIMGALYSSTMFIGVCNCLTVLPVINNDRVVFYRERAAGMYSPGPYAAAQVGCPGQGDRDVGSHVIWEGKGYELLVVLVRGGSTCALC